MTLAASGSFPLRDVTPEKRECEAAERFQAACSRNVEALLKHWNWYLYCLTFESGDFTSDREKWNRLPEEIVVNLVFGGEGC